MTAAREAVAGVVDPELRVVTIDELGILREVETDDRGHVTVTITPTYTGCPAMDVIRADIGAALRAAGHADHEVRTVFAPAWSTDWISPSGREKLAAAGVAPPGPSHAVALSLAVRCTNCGSADTEQLSRFGSTACKALWRCRACREPFDAMKAY
ncbi:phenylacetate-CoA oxygenase subunit PaaJ [Asanoa ishikariensis]|uniref:Ring-1,2-phenylacetyl-CoA epoxidase subunit PaaD n=1 Tax=Asanoa ishikariensis TaxID=137265 RepID=A0A1H3LDS7_9ACTN|nr:1,2-phenylacetyl-CoA epoxidase subunit PaaD [Asanoa ishikariensis]GIF65393.1 phenylacetate-CoA oxygenase subunit PaaJ [Asanoa ishikariensis]SDY62108.1 ring-1,2-phenylacetyl-CoA epoxidase subunit PaaD [Asanoa ishikariensis]